MKAYGNDNRLKFYLESYLLLQGGDGKLGYEIKSTEQLKVLTINLMVYLLHL